MNFVRSFVNYAIFRELCDPMRFEVDCAKSHQCLTSEGLIGARHLTQREPVYRLFLPRQCEGWVSCASCYTMIVSVKGPDARGIIITCLNKKGERVQVFLLGLYVAASAQNGYGPNRTQHKIA